jgi:hypothetical protein
MHISDVPIVADIRLAIVGNATMLLINSGFHNRKSPTSAKNNLVRVNSTQTHPKWQDAQLSCILLPKAHIYYKEYGLNLIFESQGLFSSNSIWHVMIHSVQYGKHASEQKWVIFEINFDYFRLINRKCASDYSDDRLLFFVWLPITNAH